MRWYTKEVKGLISDNQIKHRHHTRKSRAVFGYRLTLQSKQKNHMENCEHICSGNCRRVGCNCECGEYHGVEND